MLENRKLLFFDIDGTLLPHGEFEIRKEVIDAINVAKNKGAIIFICTGRCYHQAKKYIDQLGTDSYICSNGQEVCIEGKIIYQKLFPKDLLTETIQYLTKIKCSWGFETNKNICISEGTHAVSLKNVLEGYGFQDIEISSDYLKTGVYQVWIFDTPEKILEAEAGLNEMLTYYKWNDNSVEIQPGDENKGIGVLKVAQYFNNNVDTYGFGDGINDLEFLSTVRNSVAMENGEESIKNIADFICPSCEENGIITALQHYNLI